MRGYFGIGVEGISKQMNAGSLFRTAHAFGASFLFTVGAVYARAEGRRSDTSDTTEHLPLYEFAQVGDLALPKDCMLVGVELLDDAVTLPSFRHPPQAAYVLGPERGALSPALTALCDHVVKIPTKFSVNLAVAGAIVMYDRLTSLGRFASRPVAPGGPSEDLPPHVFGEPVRRRKRGKVPPGTAG
ncbi:MAG: RNA methyltransferase [Alphaproteobacteria bacterium]|nr:RNA methyltransferase [Alphaproteobacteria bacterium]